jgi:hypothetical protein
MRRVHDWRFVCLIVHDLKHGGGHGDGYAGSPLVAEMVGSGEWLAVSRQLEPRRNRHRNGLNPCPTRVEPHVFRCSDRFLCMTQRHPRVAPRGQHTPVFIERIETSTVRTRATWHVLGWTDPDRYLSSARGCDTSLGWIHAIPQLSHARPRSIDEVAYTRRPQAMTPPPLCRDLKPAVGDP